MSSLSGFNVRLMDYENRIELVLCDILREKTPDGVAMKNTYDFHKSIVLLNNILNNAESMHRAYDDGSIKNTLEFKHETTINERA